MTDKDPFAWNKTIQQLFLAEPITGDKALQLAANKPGPDPVFRLETRKTGEAEDLVLYRVELQPEPQLGLSEGPDNKRSLVFGMHLVRVYYRGFDLLEDEMANGLEGDCLQRIHLPEGGLELGGLYYAVATNLQRDPETCHVEDWDVQLRKYEGEIPADGIELGAEDV